MPISSSIKSQQPSSSQADFHPLWTMTTAQAIATVMDTGITPSITETRDLGETTSLSPMEGKAGSKLNFCQVLEKQHMSVLNDKKIEIAFINPTQTYSHSPPPGFGHNCIIQRLLTVWAAHPASRLALTFPRVSSPHHAWISQKGPPAAFPSEIKPFPEGTALSQAPLASQTNPVMSERWQTSTYIWVLLSTIPWQIQVKPWSPQPLHGTFPPGQFPWLSQNMGVREQSSSVWHTTIWWTGKPTPIMRHNFIIFLWIIPKEWGQTPGMEEVELKCPASTFNRKCLQHLIARKPQLIVLQYQ